MIDETETTGESSSGNRGLIIGLVVGVTLLAVICAGAAIGYMVLRIGNESAGAGGEYAELSQGIDRSFANGAPGFFIGDEDAPVTLVEYGDFSCPHCANLAPTMDEVVATYVTEGEVRIVFKPVTFVNPETSEPAARASYCAAEQGVFWEMHDQIWAIYAASGANGYTTENLTARAELVPGMDIDAFSTCFASTEAEQAIAEVQEEVQDIEIRGTPTVFLNGEQVQFSVGVEELPEHIDDKLAEFFDL